MAVLKPIVSQNSALSVQVELVPCHAALDSMAVADPMLPVQTIAPLAV